MHSVSKLANSEKSLEKIQLSWHEVPLNMKIFSRSMLRLGYELNVSTTSNESALVEFKKLRDDTRRDALIYVKQILPVAQKVIQNMSNYFDIYKALSYEEWKENLKSIHQNVVKYKVTCDILIQMHESLMKDLKAKLGKASVNFKEMDRLNAQYKKKVQELEAEARSLNDSAQHSRLVGSIVGIFTFGIGTAIGEGVASNKQHEANKKVIDATAKQQQIEIISDASKLCCNVLIPALSAFIEGLETVSGFFSATEMKLGKIADNTEDEDSDFVYFKTSQEVGKEINEDCTEFAKVLPAIRSDMAAIPEDSSDANYVDMWRKNALKELKENFEKKTAERGLRKVFYRVLKSTTLDKIED